MERQREDLTEWRKSIGTARGGSTVTARGSSTETARGDGRCRPVRCGRVVLAAVLGGHGGLRRGSARLWSAAELGFAAEMNFVRFGMDLGARGGK